LVGLVALAAFACGDDSLTGGGGSNQGGDGTGNNTAEGGGGRTSEGGTPNTGGNPPEGGGGSNEGGAGGQPPAEPAPPGNALVSAGDYVTSPNYKLVFTMGQPTQNQSKMTSPNFRLQGGLIGATGNLP
jgi:hypothetical protein